MPHGLIIMNLFCHDILIGERGQASVSSSNAFSRKLGKDRIPYFFHFTHSHRHPASLQDNQTMFSLAPIIGRRAGLSVSRSFATVGSQIPSGIELHSEILY